MQEEKMSFVICEYDKNKIGQRINVVHVESNKIIEEERTCLNCETCVNNKSTAKQTKDIFDESKKEEE